MTGKRLFVAIELPASTKRFLVDLDPQIHGVRWLDAGQMHLTLGFFGVVPEDVDLKLREKLSAIVFGASFPIAQTRPGSCVRRGAGAGPSYVPSTHHARAMPAHLARTNTQILESEC